MAQEHNWMLTQDGMTAVLMEMALASGEVPTRRAGDGRLLLQRAALERWMAAWQAKPRLDQMGAMTEFLRNPDNKARVMARMRRRQQ